MDTWDQIQCEDVYNDSGYSDTWYLRQEIEAWEIEQINLELQQISDNLKQEFVL